MNVTCEMGIAGAGAMLITEDGSVGGDLEIGSDFEADFALLKFAKADFWALEIDENTRRFTHQLTDFTDARDAPRMIVLSAMRGIQTEYIDAGVD